jgi:hypothetical protein
MYYTVYNYWSGRVVVQPIRTQQAVNTLKYPGQFNNLAKKRPVESVLIAVPPEPKTHLSLAN